MLCIACGRRIWPWEHFGHATTEARYEFWHADELTDDEYLDSLADHLGAEHPVLQLAIRTEIKREVALRRP